MEKWIASAYNFEFYDGSRILECTSFMINPVDSLDEVVSWINSLPVRPDQVRINFKIGGCLFDNDDTRILNNTFFCKKID